MQELTRNTSVNERPVKAIQFGEGNFLRAFVDWIIDILNEKSDFNGNVAVVQPLEQGMVQNLADQGGLYHHLRQGIEGGNTVDEIRKIECIAKAINPFTDLNAFFSLAEEPEVRLIFSNTTEAGIAYESEKDPKKNTLAKTFPGKLTQLLKHRFDHFKGSRESGVAIIPCELIEKNGTKLQDCILKYVDQWNFGENFKKWVSDHCFFANTLVDRIVPGYPKEEAESLEKRIGYHDNLIVKSEAFHLFVIQAPEEVKRLFPAHEIGLNVKYVSDITPYRTQKVRILNGAHTSMVPIGLLNGLETVRETMDNEETGKLIREIIFDEIVPTIQIPGEDPTEFAEEIISRFKNPFIRHELMSIALNSISKFKVRVLPTILDYLDIMGKLPTRLCFALACLMKLYLDKIDKMKDDKRVLEFFENLQSLSPEEVVIAVLSNKDLWGQDLTQVNGMEDLVLSHFTAIASDQMKEVLLNI